LEYQIENCFPRLFDAQKEFSRCFNFYYSVSVIENEYIGIQNVVNYKGLWIPIHDIECLKFQIKKPDVC